MDLICKRILDVVKFGLILIDDHGQVQMWNAWMAKHSGIPADSALNHSIETLFGEGVAPSFKTAIKNALSHKLPIVLSSALHRSPLPLYSSPHTQERMHQSITITPLVADETSHFFLIQITDSSMHVRRERVLKSRSDQLSKDATTDSLTGAYNRRFFDDRYRMEFGRAKRQATPLALIMLDIDFFKQYNDNYGHPAGDKVLVRTFNAMKTQLRRPTDVVARYGGEEFAIILPDCEKEGGLSVAEKLRIAVSDLHIPHRGSKIADHLTISVGVATLPPGMDCAPNDLLHAADAALYDAKRNGRNCVQHRTVMT